MAEEGTYRCRASAASVGVLLSRMAHVKRACKFTCLLLSAHYLAFILMPLVLWCCWLGGRKGIQPE